MKGSYGMYRLYIYFVCIVLYVSGCTIARYKTAEGDSVVYGNIGDFKGSGLRARVNSKSGSKLDISAKELDKNKETVDMMEALISKIISKGLEDSK